MACKPFHCTAACLCCCFMTASSLWSQVIEAGSPTRAEHVVAWDESSRSLLIHGGNNGSGFNGDLWTFNSLSGLWTQTPAGTCGGSTCEWPATRASHAAAWDHASRGFWLHGGYTEQTGVWHRDIWKFQDNDWTLELLHGGPCGRRAHVAVWDPYAASLWVHGGTTGAQLLPDLWQFTSSSQRWHKVPAQNAPSARSDHIGFWDSSGQGKLWLHGGYGAGLLAELWTMDMASTTWSTVVAQGGPTARLWIRCEHNLSFPPRIPKPPQTQIPKP